MNKQAEPLGRTAQPAFVFTPAAAFACENFSHAAALLLRKPMAHSAHSFRRAFHRGEYRAGDCKTFDDARSVAPEKSRQQFFAYRRGKSITQNANLSGKPHSARRSKAA